MKLRHYLWCLTLLGVIGFLFYHWKSSDVFPSASIDIRLTKAEIGRRSRQWAEQLGYKETKPIESTVFAYDDDAKTFLEKELGSTEANALMKQTIPIWYWNTRFCKPLKQEEFTCWITPEGRLASFEHEIENDRALPNMSHEEAQAAAEKFIKAEGQQSLEGYKLTEDSSVKQAHRIDHSFTWEDTVANYAGGKLRTHVYISGQTITAYNHFLHVPEAWSRKFAKLRSYNDALAEFATIFYVALQTGSFFLFIWAFASGLVRWRFCLIVSGVYAVFAAVESVNNFAVSLHEYSSNMPFAGFELDFVLSTITAALGSFLQTFVLVAAAEALYRKFFPEKIAMEKLFTDAGVRSARTLNGLIAGCSSFGVHLGWIVLFYLCGRPLGFWCPMEVQNSESLSSTVPAISAMHVGFTASLSEEFLYRILGLIAFQRLVKNFWLANLLQAAAWAFMHSNYPQEPPYARGVELTFVGFFYGTILRYFGILPCVFSHNLIDTFLGLEPLLASSVRGLRLSAYVTLLPYFLLILASFVIQKRKGLFADQNSLTNKELTATVTPAVEVTQELAPKSYPYKPHSTKTRIVLSVIAVASLLIQFLYHPPAVGNKVQLTLTREQAITKAQEYLEKRDVQSQGYSVVANLVNGLDEEEMQYVYENDRTRFKELIEKPERPLLWKVRFYKPLVQEEYLVIVDSYGTPMSLGIALPENEPGARLTRAEAQAKVEAVLNKEHKEIVPIVFDDATEVKRDARTDYTFEFKAPRYRIGQADYRITSECIGDQVSGYDHSWVLPDQWTFARKKVGLRETICKYAVIGFYLLFSGALVIWAKGVLKSQAIVWKPAIVIGLILSAATLVKTLNGTAEFFANYATEKPLVSFFVDQSVGYLIAIISTFSIYSALAAFGLAALRLLLPNTTVPAIIRTTFMPADHTERVTSTQVWIDATIIGFSTSVGLRAVWLIVNALGSKISPSVTLAPLDNVCLLANMYDSTVSTTIDAFSRGLLSVMVAAILVGLYLKYLRKPKNYIFFALIVSALLPSAARYWQDYIFDFAGYVVWSAVGYFVVSKLAKDNLLAYFIAGYVATLIGVMRVLLDHCQAVFLDDIIFMTALLLSPIAYVIFRVTKGKAPQIEITE